MKKTSTFAITLLLVAATRSLAVTPPPASDPENEPYEERMADVRRVGQRFPGQTDLLNSDLKDVGLFAGIYLQTRWQLETGRYQIGIWQKVNRVLSVVPGKFAQEYDAQPALADEQSPYVVAHPTRDAEHAPVTQPQVCHAWKIYFRLADQVRDDLKSGNPMREVRGLWTQRMQLRPALWHAHTLAVRESIWQLLAEFEHPDLPEQELKFWRGWCRLVFFIEHASPRSTDFLLEPFLKEVMPRCAPLGGGTCSVGEQTVPGHALLDFLIFSGGELPDAAALVPPRTDAAPAAGERDAAARHLAQLEAALR